jgi:hypothetical protein
VCGLDSALCNKWRRAEFLELVSRRVLLFNREEIDVLKLRLTTRVHNYLGAVALRWIQKRGIHLASLVLADSSDINAAEQQCIRESVASLALNGLLDKLETCDLNGCSYIKNADLAAILSKCYGSIKSMGIQDCGLIVSSAAHIKRCTRLEAFDANGTESPAEMVAIFESCRKLRSVDLQDLGHRLTDEVLFSVAAHFPLMERINIQCCNTVSDAAIRALAESCPLLQSIFLVDTAITDATVVTMCMRCPLLKLIYIGGCDNLTDAAVLAVAERLPGLTEISLGGIDAITSSAVKVLVSKCRDLEVINMAYCPNINDGTLARIAEHCSRLGELRINGCLNVTAVGLAEVATECARLHTVQIGNGLGEAAVAALREMFPHVVWDEESDEEVDDEDENGGDEAEEEEEA